MRADLGVQLLEDVINPAGRAFRIGLRGGEPGLRGVPAPDQDLDYIVGHSCSPPSSLRTPCSSIFSSRRMLASSPAISDGSFLNRSQRPRIVRASASSAGSRTVVPSEWIPPGDRKSVV